MLQPLLLLTTHLTYAIDTECKKPEVQRRVLPEIVNNNKTGYHVECYRKCTVVGRNTPPKNEGVE